MLCYFDLKETIFKSYVKQPVPLQRRFVQHQLRPVVHVGRGPKGGGGLPGRSTGDWRPFGYPSFPSLIRVLLAPLFPRLSRAATARTGAGGHQASYRAPGSSSAELAPPQGSPHLLVVARTRGPGPLLRLQPQGGCLEALGKGKRQGMPSTPVLFQARACDYGRVRRCACISY